MRRSQAKASVDASATDAASAAPVAGGPVDAEPVSRLAAERTADPGGSGEEFDPSDVLKDMIEIGPHRWINKQSLKKLADEI